MKNGFEVSSNLYVILLFMKPANFMQQPLAVIVQQLLVEELLEVKKKQKTYLKGRKYCERMRKKKCGIKESEYWPNLHYLIPHFPVISSNSHSFLPHFQL